MNQLTALLKIMLALAVCWLVWPDLLQTGCTVGRRPKHAHEHELRAPSRPRLVLPAPAIARPVELPLPPSSQWDRLIEDLKHPPHPLFDDFVEAMNDPGNRELVFAVVPRGLGRSLNLGHIVALHDSLMAGWEPFGDPVGRDVVQSPVTTFRYRRGDCDDIAAAYTALCAIDVPVRIVIAELDGESNHAYAEACLGDIDAGIVQRYLRLHYGLTPDDPIGLRRDSYGNLWLNLDTGAAYAGAPYLNASHGWVIYPTQSYCLSF